MCWRSVHTHGRQKKMVGENSLRTQRDHLIKYMTNHFRVLVLLYLSSLCGSMCVSSFVHCYTDAIGQMVLSCTKYFQKPWWKQVWVKKVIHPAVIKREARATSSYHVPIIIVMLPLT